MLERGAEVRDHRNRLIRTNHVVFTEGGDDVNQTVSRTHGHIAYEPLSGHFRLHDDGSEHGTEVVRGARTISVLRGSRGVRLQSDDEVVLEEARGCADHVSDSVRLSPTKKAVRLLQAAGTTGLILGA